MTCRRANRLALFLLALLLPVSARAQVPVVPGASGVGMTTRAAYGCSGNPTIYTVTSLADDGGTGTFRYAVTQPGPRVVIFGVSGYITLLSTLGINTPCITIAGQTAPSPGITIRTGGGGATDIGIYLNTTDVLMQHLRIRPGRGNLCNSGLQVYGGAQHNIVFDHMSFSWGQDENLAFNWTNGQSTDAVVWQSIMAEGLLQAPGSSGCTGGGTSNGHGILIDTNAGKVAVVQSLFSTNYERNPYMLGATASTLVNNVIYQWHGPWGFFWNNGSVCGPGCGTNDPWFASVVGNRFIKGPNTCCTGGGDDTSAYMFVYSVNGTDSPNIAGNKIYKTDNTIANQDGTVVVEANGYSYDPNVGAAPAEAPMPVGLVPLASTAAEQFVLDHAGARPLDRDGVDARIVANVKARTGTFVSDPASVGGYPALATNTTTFTLPASPHVDAGAGYTNLEVWLHAFAAALEPSVVSGPVDVAPATGSTIVTAHFTGAAGVPLTSYTADVGGSFTLQSGSTGVLALDSANRVLNPALNVGAVALSAGLPLSAEYDVAADIRVLSITAGTEYDIWARAQTGSETGYFFGINPSTQTAYLRRGVSATYALLGSCSHTFAINTTYHVILRTRNAGQHAIIDGVQCTSTADNTITAAGRAGLSAYATGAVDTDTPGATGARFDDFTVTDVTTAAAVMITTASVPNAVLTHAYSVTASATGGTPPYTWALGLTLPPGLSLNTSTGTISGTPTVAGQYVFNLQVTDSLGATVLQPLSMFARAAASIVTTTLPVSVLNTPYSTTVVGAGDEAPSVWAVSIGTLPAGLTLGSSTGIISGTPTVAGISVFTLRLTGALGSTTTRVESITVGAEYRPPSRPISRNQAEGVVYRRPTAPTNPADGSMRGDLWVNTSTVPPTVYVCTGADATTAVWLLVP